MKLFPEIVFRNRVVAGMYCGLLSLPIVVPLGLGLLVIDKIPISELAKNIALAAMVAIMFAGFVTPIYKYFSQCNKRQLLPMGIGSRAVFSLSASVIFSIIMTVPSAPNQAGEFWLYTLQNFIFISILANAFDSAIPKAKEKRKQTKLQTTASQPIEAPQAPKWPRQKTK